MSNLCRSCQRCGRPRSSHDWGKCANWWDQRDGLPPEQLEAQKNFRRVTISPDFITKVQVEKMRSTGQFTKVKGDR